MFWDHGALSRCFLSQARGGFLSFTHSFHSVWKIVQKWIQILSLSIATSFCNVTLHFILAKSGIYFPSFNSGLRGIVWLILIRVMQGRVRKGLGIYIGTCLSCYSWEPYDQHHVN
jgi:hypothetical protein